MLLFDFETPSPRPQICGGATHEPHAISKRRKRAALSSTLASRPRASSEVSTGDDEQYERFESWGENMT